MYTIEHVPNTPTAAAQEQVSQEFTVENETEPLAQELLMSQQLKIKTPLAMKCKWSLIRLTMVMKFCAKSTTVEYMPANKRCFRSS